MIHKITIENFYSIRERQVLDLRLPKTTPDMPRFRPSPSDPSIRLPTVVAFFGPNASGKSTVLRALASVVDFAARSFALGPDAAVPFVQPFRAAGWWDKPSRVVVDLDATWQDGSTAQPYRYELAIEHGPRVGQRVGLERLDIRTGRRFRNLFHREGGRTRCADDLGIKAHDRSMEMVRPNASVISTLAQLNHAFFLAVQSDLVRITENVVGHGLQQTAPPRALDYLEQDEPARRSCVHELRRLDLGIADMTIVRGPQGPSAMFEHEGLGQPISLAEASDGTRHFLRLFPSLFRSLRNGAAAIVDDFDVGMHPLASTEIVRWFQDPRINISGAQLLAATHTTAMIDELEKEEIVLVEKKRDGSTQIQALRDFRGVRRDPSIARKYLGGMFGALPNIG